MSCSIPLQLSWSKLRHFQTEDSRRRALVHDLSALGHPTTTNKIHIRESGEVVLNLELHEALRLQAQMEKEGWNSNLQLLRSFGAVAHRPTFSSPRRSANPEGPLKSSLHRKKDTSVTPSTAATSPSPGHLTDSQDASATPPSNTPSESNRLSQSGRVLPELTRKAQLAFIVSKLPKLLGISSHIWVILPQHLIKNRVYIAGFPSQCLPVVENDSLSPRSDPARNLWTDDQVYALYKALSANEVKVMPREAGRVVLFEVVEPDGRKFDSTLGFSKEWLARQGMGSAIPSPKQAKAKPTQAVEDPLNTLTLRRSKSWTSGRNDPSLPSILKTTVASKPLHTDTDESAAGGGSDHYDDILSFNIRQGITQGFTKLFAQGGIRISKVPWRTLPAFLAEHNLVVSGFPEDCVPVVKNDRVITSNPTSGGWSRGRRIALLSALQNGQIKLFRRPPKREVIFRINVNGKQVDSTLGYSDKWIKEHLNPEKEIAEASSSPNEARRSPSSSPLTDSDDLHLDSPNVNSGRHSPVIGKRVTRSDAARKRTYSFSQKDVQSDSTPSKAPRITEKTAGRGNSSVDRPSIPSKLVPARQTIRRRSDQARLQLAPSTSDDGHRGSFTSKPPPSAISLEPQNIPPSPKNPPDSVSATDAMDIDEPPVASTSSLIFPRSFPKLLRTGRVLLNPVSSRFECASPQLPPNSSILWNREMQIWEFKPTASTIRLLESPLLYPSLDAEFIQHGIVILKDDVWEWVPNSDDQYAIDVPGALRWNADYGSWELLMQYESNA